jgi:hypothetical protein
MVDDGAGLAAASYAAHVATTWYRYGRVTGHAGADDRDELLDHFMPTYEVAERHHVRIAAPAAIRWALLGPLKAEAERRVQAAGASPTVEVTP